MPPQTKTTKSATYVVLVSALNVWDPDEDLKDAKKERLVVRHLKGAELSEDDLKHADLDRLLENRFIAKKSDVDKEPEAAVVEIPAGTTGVTVPEAQGAVIPESH